MFRWFKGGKKDKGKSFKDRNTTDNYGFNELSNGKGSTANGFSDTRRDPLDSSLHIYDEISELPEISFSRQFTLLPEETNLRTNAEGPYLVVPILPQRRGSVDSSVVERDTSISKSSVDNTMEYNEPWDTLKDTSDRNIQEVHAEYPNPAFRDSGSGYTCSSISTRTESSRTNDSDTGCEYDMSISTESEVSSEYKELINKMQNNLALKHQILEMIKESENGSQKQKRHSKESSSSLDSCEFIRVREVYEEDESESDYSSGFDECEINGNIDYQIPQTGNNDQNLPVFVPCFDDIRSTNQKAVHVKTLCTRPKRHDSMKSKSSSASFKRNSWNQPVPTLVPKPTNIYSNGRRGYGSNRLLSDLINMNHNMQTMKF